MLAIRVSSQPQWTLEASPEVSVVVPTYAETKQDATLLERLMGSLVSQVSVRMEVVISDHSVGDIVMSVLRRFSDDLDIAYVRNDSDRGYSRRNLNLAISLASGRYLKPMDMDDYLERPDALAHMIRAAEERSPGHCWVVAGFTGRDADGSVVYGPVTPSVETTLGPPSTLLFPNDRLRPLFFHQHLLIINDHEMQQQLPLKYGKPEILDDALVGIGHHAGQVSERVNLDQLALERHYFQVSQRLLRASGVAAWEMVQPPQVRRARFEASQRFPRSLTRTLAKWYYALGRRLLGRSYDLSLLERVDPPEGGEPLVFEYRSRGS